MVVNPEPGRPQRGAHGGLPTGRIPSADAYLEPAWPPAEANQPASGRNRPVHLL
jgi:hypothetical protein